MNKGCISIIIAYSEGAMNYTITKVTSFEDNQYIICHCQIVPA